MAQEWDMDAIAAKWQARWWAEGLHHAERPAEAAASGGSGVTARGRARRGAGDDSGSDRERGGGEAARATPATRPTFFLHFAYPGISGYLHVGHMRGFTYTDVIARCKRQTGHDVLFPAGFHASGIPAVAFAKEVERGEKTQYLLDNGFDPARDGPVEALADPAKVVEYFARVYTHDYWKRFGFLIDDRRNCTTIDPGYQRFIQWQFRRLHDKGYLTQKPHYAPFCPVAGPVAVDKSETDIKQGGNAEVKEFVCLRFSIPAGDIVDTDDAYDAIILPCATLRPETLFGVTNLWIHPEHEYELVRVWQDGAVTDDDATEVWLVSKQGRVKLEWQCERAEALGVTVPGSALVGKAAAAPLTGAQVPVVAASFVDPMIATGIVMSVPGHAPFDWAAYVDAGLDKTLGEPPRIVEVPGYDDLPARAACAKHNVRSQQDQEALQAATDEVYAAEFAKGVLTKACGEWAGQPVRAAKDAIVAAFLERGHGRILRQFSELVVSRAGEVVDIKRIPDQDFIRYSDPDWTAQAKAHAATMQVFPARYKEELPNVLDWFGDRACVRRGAWLGTEFPFKAGWIIEPIADSTFYSWYYIVSLYVNDGRLAPTDLTDGFFDFVFNGKGRPAAPVWDEVRADVLHWGPVDINLGGKEHQTVHFPVWTMTMVGLMDDPALWPRGIFVNWWVTQAAGAKISKSKGGAEPIPGAAARYGVDAMRLYYCHVGSPHVDIEWDPDVVLDYRRRVQRIQRITDELLGVAGPAGPMDAWLEAAFAQHLRAAQDAYDACDLRRAAGELAFAVPEALRWYQRRGGENGDLLGRVVRDWATALCPIVPHTAEEMFERAGGEGLCSLAQMARPVPPDGAAVAAEEYLRSVLDDIATVKKLAGVEAPRVVWLFAAPAWKRDAMLRALELAQGAPGRFPMAELMQALMRDAAMRERGKQVQAFAARLPQTVLGLTAGQRTLLQGAVDETALLRAAARFVARETGAEQVHIFAADDPGAPEHAKRGAASPLRPGIAVE